MNGIGRFAAGLTAIFALLTALTTVNWGWANTTISFVSDRDEYRNVFLIDARTESLVPLIPWSDHPILYSSYRWLPDGDHLLLRSCATFECYDWLLDMATRHPTPIDSQAARAAPRRSEAASPDEAYIVGTALRNGNWEIVVHDVSAGTDQQITANDALDTAPVWSPDGTRIAFVSTRSGNAEIYVMPPDGRDQQRLTSTNCDSAAPSWSPDSRSIVFTMNCSGRYHIGVVNADGTGMRRLMRANANDTAPAWRP